MRCPVSETRWAGFVLIPHTYFQCLFCKMKTIKLPIYTSNIVMLHIQSTIRLAWHVLGVNKKTISIRPVPSNFLLSYLQVVTRCLYYIKPMLYICADRMLTQCHPHPQRINVCLPWDIDDINEITSRLNNSCTLLSHKVLLKNIFVACFHQL